MGNLTKARLATMVWKIMNHPPYRPELAACDFHTLVPMKVHLVGQKFQTDDEFHMMP
jgi:hypothetical protein